MNSWLWHECMLLHSTVSSCKCHIFRACFGCILHPGFCIAMNRRSSRNNWTRWDRVLGGLVCLAWILERDGCRNLRVAVCPPQGQQPEENNGIKGVINHHDLLRRPYFLEGLAFRVLRFPWYSPQLRSDAPVMHPWKGLLDPIVGPIGV